MSENVYNSMKVESVLKPVISEDEARRIVGEWAQANILTKKDNYRLGKAVLVYYPFWQYIREDGGEIKTVCKPAWGAIRHNIQSMEVSSDLIPLTDETVLPASINASYYYSELYGIPRKETLIAIPFWLISYKYKYSIYMMKLNADTGEVIPEWHPFKDPVNWPKIAMLSGIPVLLMSMLGVFVHGIFFLFMVIYVLALLGYSRMLSILNTKRAEEEVGDSNA